MKFRTLYLLSICVFAALLFVIVYNMGKSRGYTRKYKVKYDLNTSKSVVSDVVSTVLPATSNPVTMPETPTTRRPDNYQMKLTFCSMKFKEGLMCPPLYTELGGNCSRNSTGSFECTDVRSLASHSLRQAQLAITRMLGIFNNIAQKHNIKYWITSATLLGAARHKGFVPWDSDADIEISLDEYEKFFRYGSRELPDDVFFQNTESDPKLRPDPKTYPGYYEKQKYKDIGMYIRTWNPRLRDTKSCYKYCISHGCKWHDGLMIDIYVVEDVPKGTYPLKQLLFEGLPFPVPNNWENVLKNQYGDDFLEVPAEGHKNREQWDWPDPTHSCKQLEK